MSKAVFCIANNVVQADRIVDKLQESGFDSESISFLMSDRKGGTKQFTTEEVRYNAQSPMRERTGRSTSRLDRPNTFQESSSTYRERPSTLRDTSSSSTLRGYDTDYVERETIEEEDVDFQKIKRKNGALATERHTKAPEGATTGALTGGIVGGSLGLLAGIGAIAIPGLGAFIAAGPIVAALSGSGIGGAVGLLVGSLIGFGIPEYEAKKYESALKSGGILLCVHAEDSKQIKKIKDILEKEGARDISVSQEA
jgi:hypothetical protein